jgi:hypothetical protein
MNVTVLVATVHTESEALLNTTGLPDAPLVAVGAYVGPPTTGALGELLNATVCVPSVIARDPVPLPDVYPTLPAKLPVTVYVPLSVGAVAVGP